MAHALLRLLSGPAFSTSNKPFILVTLIVSSTGFCLTLIMASVFRRIINRGGNSQWALAAIVVIISAAVFGALEIWGFVAFIDRGWRPSVWDYTYLAFFDLFIMTSWSGLYFGINYYLMAQDQHRRLLAMSTQAHEAQLKMLRYQINPHFLFNTLNSISTLVLIKDTERANAMLERLAAFLRSTLVDEPTQTVPLMQELKTLQLYLDIERLRFQDRLNVVYNIDPDCMTLQLPALLLQPLVENAIKYAVAAEEAGATITIAAERNRHGAIITISDTGPGMCAEAVKASAAKGTGVGLANTRERLLQVFGGLARFHISGNEPHGTCVTITLPKSSDDEPEFYHSTPYKEAAE